MGSNGDQVEIGSQVEKRRPGRKMAEKGPKMGWQKKGRKWVRALCAMILETAEQAKVIFSTLVSYESQKSEVHKTSHGEP